LCINRRLLVREDTDSGSGKPQMKVKVYTVRISCLVCRHADTKIGHTARSCVFLSCQDKNLHRAVAGGWNLKALAEGKIGTLGGRTIEVNVLENATVRALKRAIEDQEGISVEGMSIRTTSDKVFLSREWHHTAQRTRYIVCMTESQAS
jgi:hypothetical protein